MAEDASKQIAALRPKDAKTLDEYCRVVGGAVDVLIGDHLPTAEDISYENVAEKDRGTYTEYLGLVRNKEHGSELPTIFLHPKQWNKKVVIWADENGKAGLFSSDGSPTPEVRALLDAGTSVAGVDLLFQGEFNADGKAPDKARRVKTIAPSPDSPRATTIRSSLSACTTCCRSWHSPEITSKSPNASTWWASTARERGWPRPRRKPARQSIARPSTRLAFASRS